jgi:hypothetical protein
MDANSPLIKFDPHKIACYEKENYVAYYQKRWLRLLRVSVGLVKETYHLSMLQAVYAAYLVARAEIAFAPFPDNDVPSAIAYMRSFFAFINQVHHLQIDIDHAAQVEVNWWSVHRRLFGQAENQDLVEALVKSYVVAYGLEAESVRPAAYHRAQGMLYSDLWVNDGQKNDSPYLQREEEELAKGYTLLQASLATRVLPTTTSLSS